MQSGTYTGFVHELISETKLGNTAHCSKSIRARRKAKAMFVSLKYYILPLVSE
jgi:hypothetical protein